MASLYLLRHAKSGHDDPSLADHDRPLNARGLRASRAIGRYFLRMGMRPEVVLCSTATRTRQTLDLLVEAAGWPAGALRVNFEERLYLASPAQILAVIGTLGLVGGDVMVIGHNPGMHDLALTLCTDESPALPQVREKFPTAALATFQVDVREWSDLANRRFALTDFVLPRALEDT